MIEFLLTSVRYKTEFATNGEYVQYALGFALLGALPVTFVACCTLNLCYRKPRNRGGLAALLGGVFAWSISYGRHFQAMPIRAAFVLALAAGAAAFVWLAARIPARLRAPLLVSLALAALWCDLHLLPDLYAGFHLACVCVLVGVLMLLRAAPPSAWRTHARMEFDVVAVLAAAAALFFASVLLKRADNVRRIGHEHGLLARFALAAAPGGMFRSGENDGEASSAPPSHSYSGSSPDWSGKDILLFTVDALRADHLGAYGYKRPTTPNFDALAAQGTRFGHAYCPTPHTSYSVTSMMTGKYMHPLVALGLGAESETLAGWLQTYNYRTAGFYPPAVFYIDGPKFASFEAGNLGFEYSKREFAGRELRASQVRKYLQHAPKDKPLFLWVHAFEPHEPYVKHAAHDYGDAPIDRYDSEVAEADALFGDVVAAMRAERPRAVVWVAADHGEEFGEHGGMYHGTTLFEEQVRVPMIVAGPGVLQGVVDAPVQTIDIAATVLGALHAPHPARLRGLDLGGFLTHTGAPTTYAYADTDMLSLYATGNDRLLCRKREAYCDLYDVAADPTQHHNLARANPDRVAALRAAMRGVERAHGTFERGAASDLPEALRVALSGDRDAAPDAAALLDDVRPLYRAKAAEALADIGGESERAALARALSGELDANTKLWLTLALARSGGAIAPDSSLVAAMHAPDTNLRTLGTLQRAAQGQGSYADLHAMWRARVELSMPRTLELMNLMASKFPRDAAPEFAAALDSVVLRAELVRQLHALKDARTANALAAVYEHEPYVNLRAPELQALVAMGAGARADVLRATRSYLRLPDVDPKLAEIALKLGQGEK